MAQMNQYEGIVGVRSGSGITDGMKLSLSGAPVGTTITIAAGQYKTRFNNAAAAQRLNEGGDVKEFAAVSPAASQYTAMELKDFWVMPDGTVITNDQDASGNLIYRNAVTGVQVATDPMGSTQMLPGPIMSPGLTAMRVNSGAVYVGSAEVYSNAGVKTFRNIDYSRRETL